MPTPTDDVANAAATHHLGSSTSVRIPWPRLALVLGAAVGAALILAQRPFGDVLVIVSVLPVVAASRLVGAPFGTGAGLLLSLLDTLTLALADSSPLRLLSLAPLVLALPLLGLAGDSLQTAALRAQRVADLATRDAQRVALDLSAHVEREAHLQRRSLEQTALWELAAPAATGASISAFLRLVVQAIVSVLGTDQAAVLISADDDSGRLLVASDAGDHDGTDQAESEQDAYASRISVPVAGPASAVITTRAHAPRSFSSFDIVFLESVARIVGAVLERSHAEHTLQNAAMYDRLTGVANRVLMQDRLHSAVSDARRDHTGMALLVLDLDRFKEVNDTLGHHWGDVLLKNISKRLQNLVKSTDTVARLGGDEFAIILPSVHDVETATKLVQRLVNAIVEPVLLDTGTVAVGASIGLVLYPQHGENAEVLLRRADVAMYVAKRGNLDYSVYSSELDRYTTDRLERVAELREAIDDATLVLHYQPLLSVRDRVVVGFEALVRWPHPHHGLLGADDFVPLAEEVGLIKPLDHWVLNAAIRQCGIWSETGIQTPVAVNLSMRNILDSRLPDLVTELLAKWNVAPTLLHLEITESTIMADPRKAMEVLARLRAMRVEISIDDFGTGYSSMEYLKRLPMDSLKIDRSFVQDMAADRRDLAIVRSVIELGHNIGLRVIAEGVENLTTLTLLDELGCDEAQGRHVGLPLAPEVLGEWLAANRHQPAHVLEAA